MSRPNTMLLVLCLTTLSACGTTPLREICPPAPAELLTPPESLGELQKGARLSDILRQHVEDSGAHNEISDRLRALQEWVKGR